MRHDSVYNSKNIFLLLGLFVMILLLMYSLASFLHENQKINREIEAIQYENEKTLAEIEEKKQQLEYLETPQRVDKDAKMQMGKKLPGENVLVFLEEIAPLTLLPGELSSKKFHELLHDPMIAPIEKWKYLFFGPKNLLQIRISNSLEKTILPQTDQKNTAEILDAQNISELKLNETLEEPPKNNR
ncbi:hypothetical protein HN954_05185 [bacterium]|jgi:cell division protein FtsL|nr:hypothetical protein [bacterium]MBT6996787.1 hypothetical protein [bacterium]